MKKKALGIGEIVLDKVHQVTSFPQEGEKVLAQEVQLTLGGPVPAALVLLSRLGVECVLIASVADDEASAVLKNILAKEGVHLLAQKTMQTPVHTVLVNRENGSRTIIKDVGATGTIRRISQELVRSADIILCDRHEPKAILAALCDKREETPVIMDPSVDCSEQTIKLLKRMNFPIIPIETLQILFPKKTIRESARKMSDLLGKPLVVTMGEFGSAVCENDAFVIHPSIPVKVVDTLGAGDIFRGGFAFGILQEWDIHRCVQFANSVAALQCTKLGNSTAIPTRDEIIAFQKSSVQLSNSCSLI